MISICSTTFHSFRMMILFGNGRNLANIRCCEMKKVLSVFNEGFVLEC